MPTKLPADFPREKIFDALTLANPKVRYSIVPDPMQVLVASLLPRRTVDVIP